MGRKVKIRLPTASKLLQPQLHKDVQQRLKDRQLKQKFYFDRGARNLPTLSEGERVRLRAENRWQPAIVVKSLDKPRSYLVQTQGGEIYRRNRKHLLKTKESSFQNSHIQDSFNPVITDCIPDMDVTKQALPPLPTPEKTSSRPEGVVEKTVKVTRSGRVVRPPKRYSC